MWTVCVRVRVCATHKQHHAVCGSCLQSGVCSPASICAERSTRTGESGSWTCCALQDDSGPAAAGSGSGSGGTPSANGGLWGEAKPAQEGDRLIRDILANAKPAQIPKHPSLIHSEAGALGSCTSVHTCHSQPQQLSLDPFVDEGALL